MVMLYLYYFSSFTYIGVQLDFHISTMTGSTGGGLELILKLQWVSCCSIFRLLCIALTQWFLYFVSFDYCIFSPVRNDFCVTSNKLKTCSWTKWTRQPHLNQGRTYERVSYWWSTRCTSLYIKVQIRWHSHTCCNNDQIMMTSFISRNIWSFIKEINLQVVAIKNLEFI